MQAYSITRNNIMGRVFYGLCASLVTAFIGLFAGQYLPPAAFLVLTIVELVMIVAAMFMQRTRRIGMTFVLVFTFISGITLYPVIAAYASLLGATTLMEAVGVSAVAFLVAAIVASRTSFDFTFLGGFLFIGLMALLLMGLLSFFIGFSTQTQLVYSLIGIAVFVGYVLFDVNRMVHFGVSEQMIPWVVLSLYLDFINLLLFVLRLFGVMQGGSSQRR